VNERIELTLRLDPSLFLPIQLLLDSLLSCASFQSHLLLPRERPFRLSGERVEREAKELELQRETRVTRTRTRRRERKRGRR